MLGLLLSVGFVAAGQLLIVPAELRAGELRFWAVFFGLVLAALLVTLVVRTRSGTLAAPEERQPSLSGTRAGVSLRIALGAYEAARVVSAISKGRGDRPADRLRATIAALLEQRSAWVAGSVDAVPRATEERMESFARRMIGDATSRFGASSDPQLAERGVVVVSIVVTTSVTIDSPSSRERSRLGALLANLAALADDASTIDVRASPGVPLAELAKRDPALLPLD